MTFWTELNHAPPPSFTALPWLRCWQRLQSAQTLREYVSLVPYGLETPKCEQTEERCLLTWDHRPASECRQRAHDAGRRCCPLAATTGHVPSCLPRWMWCSSLWSVCDPVTGINVKFQNTSCTLDLVSLAKMSVSSLLVLYVECVSMWMVTHQCSHFRIIAMGECNAFQMYFNYFSPFVVLKSYIPSFYHLKWM